MESKVGSPFSFDGGVWDGISCHTADNRRIPTTEDAIKAAIEAWTPKPPEGWEEYPEEVELPYYPDGMLNPNTGHVHPLQEGKYYLLLGHSEQPNAMDAIGFVPVRKVKPAVPEWVEPFVYKPAERPEPNGAGAETVSKLNIHQHPERFSHEERATEMCNVVCEKAGLPGFQDNQRICGLKSYGIGTAAYLEGFFSAVAFMSGAVSGGKIRDFAKWMARDVDLFQMVNIADATGGKE